MDHGYRQHAIQLVGDTGDDDFESCFGPISIRSIELLGVDASCPSSAEMVPVPAPAPIPDPFVLRRLAETYDVTTSASFAHADNGSMANTVHDATLLFAYRLLKDSKVRLLDAGDHAHHPLGVGFLCVPTTNRGIAGAPHPYSFGRITPRSPGSSSRTRLFLNSSAHLDITCPLPGLPTDNNGPEPHGCGVIAEDTHPVSSPPLEPAALSDPIVLPSDPTVADGSPPSPLTNRDVCEDIGADSPIDLLVRSLPRAALRMLWHQRLGHLNFRRLSTMHRFVKGMPEFQIPNEIESCPICLAAKLRKRPAGTDTTMHSTICNQGISIDFGFMVQRSRNTKRQHNLIGLNGETCYALITDHFSGRLYGRAFATKAPPVDWVNNWLANNAPDCPNKYVRMDGGGELGKSRDIRQAFTNFGYTVEVTGPDSSNQNGPGERPHQTIGDALRSMLSGANLQANFWPYAFYHYLRLYNFVPHGTRPTSPYEMCGSTLPNLSKLRTFGCRVHVRPTTARCGKAIPNSRLGIFLGYSRSLKILYYYDLESSLVKTATHARFDEGMNDLVDKPPPNVQILRQLNNDDSPSPDNVDMSPLDLTVSDDPFDRLDELNPAIICDHPNLGFEYIGAFIVSINDQPVFTAQSAIDALAVVASSDAENFRIVFAPDRYIPVTDRSTESPLHLSVDQLRVVNQILSESAPSTSTLGTFPLDGDLSSAKACPPLVVRSLNTTTHGTVAEQALGSFTRRKLKGLSNWNDWQQTEFKQLDAMAKQEMYGTPCLPPKDAIILRQHWDYSYKADGTRKARNCCDGSPRAAPMLKLANTYSSCIEQPCMRMFFALCAYEGYVALKVDATNAYANSPPPGQPTFVYIDDQYADWYEARYGTKLSRDMVLPVQHALQGHPESGALWEGFVNKVIARHGFKSTTHERSIYHGVYKGHRMLICRQVDDLAIGCIDPDATRDLVNTICREDGIDLRDEGLLASFNGVDVEQTDRYIKITCESYIDKLLAHYGWSAAGTRDTDMKPIEPLASSTLQQMFVEYESAPANGSPEHALVESAAGFSYRSVLGALIYAYVVARPDIGYAVTTLARFSDRPTKIHYDASAELRVIYE
ncbi:retrotransposon [Fragilaria crotonensis]|nr:retrotransposon [Fragilaria crotonensis]